MSCFPQSTYYFNIKFIIEITKIILYYYVFQELYLQDNNIRKLPNEIVHLSKLNILNVARNNLKQLPEAMGKLKQLAALDISQNKSLHKLPKSLGYAQQLIQLNIEGLNLLYPSQDILNGGTIVIIAFLANESGIEYSPEDSVLETDLSRNINFEDMQDVYQNKNSNVQVSYATEP